VNENANELTLLIIQDFLNKIIKNKSLNNKFRAKMDFYHNVVRMHQTLIDYAYDELPIVLDIGGISIMSSDVDISFCSHENQKFMSADHTVFSISDPAFFNKN